MPSASTKLDEFFNVLRDCGTNLPFRNSEIVGFLRRALDDGDPSDWIDKDDDEAINAAEAMRDDLASDLEVIEQELRYQEENPE